MPSSCFSVSVKAVDSLSEGSRSSSIPRLLDIMISPFTLIIYPSGLVPASAGFCDVWMDHLHRIDDTSEFILRDEAQFQSRFSEREVVVHSEVGDLRRLVVTDDRRECRHQHQRSLNVFVDLLQV